MMYHSTSTLLQSWHRDVHVHRFSAEQRLSQALSTARKTTILPTHLYLVPLMVIPMEFHKIFAISVTALFTAVPC